MTEINELELKIKMVMDKLSNNEEVEIADEWIDEAVAHFKNALVKHLKTKQEPFRLRASTVGRPLCLNQKELAGDPKARQDYNHIMRMMIGDAVEALGMIMIRASGANVTGGKNAAAYVVDEDTTILGEDDVEIDEAVYDIKSSAPYAFRSKWCAGWDTVYADNSFGYVEQLYIYANGQKPKKKIGGWFVWDKASGEVVVVNAKFTKQQKLETEANIENSVRTLNNKLPFRKQFKEEPEVFRQKETGKMIMPILCTFCQHQKSCWPNAKLEPQTNSKAVVPKLVWYVE